MNKEQLIARLRKFIETYCYDDLLKNVKHGKQFLLVNYSELSKYDYKLSEALLDKPDDYIAVFEDAIQEFDVPGAKYPIRIRFTDLPVSQFVPIRNVRSKHLGKVIAIEGLIRQASDIRPKITIATFNCPSCGTKILVEQKGDKFSEPERCKCGRKGKFKLEDKKLTDVQALVVEEAPDSMGGEHPKRIRVLLSEDLLVPELEKRRNPGNKVSVVGVLKEIPLYSSHGTRTTRYDLMIDVNNIETVESEFEELETTPEEEQLIKKLAKDPKVYTLLAGSIAPSICGSDNIKEAIVLQLFGGVRKRRADGTSARGDIHIFLVGDPGVAKSEILSYVAKLAPKARYVVGKSASGAGITVAVVKDEFTGGWALEAGALVLADKGILCLDEMDKMGREDRSAMHSAMEQQIISVSKANIQATLNTRTTILAAANPKFGRFDPYSPIPKQIELPATLINRFDLIFPIRDIPDRETDARIAMHVLTLHKEGGEAKGTIDPNLLKKYIAYARKNYSPRLTDGAVKVIKDFYVELRNAAVKSGEEIKSIPISARQLQALVRMTEAAARVRLSNTATRKDAKRAIDLLKSCMQAVGTDPETGEFDIDRITTGITAKQRSNISIMRQVIEDLTEKYGKVLPMQDVVDNAVEAGIDVQKAREILDALKSKGDIFEPKHGYIQKVG